MIEPTQLDLQRAREITNLYGGNGLSTTQSERLVAEKLAEWFAESRLDSYRLDHWETMKRLDSNPYGICTVEWSVRSQGLDSKLRDTIDWFVKNPTPTL